MFRFFYQTLFPLTAVGSVTMLLLLALAPLAKRMSSRWQYYVRLVPLVLFIVPFAVALPFLKHPSTALAAAPAPVSTFAAVVGEVAQQPASPAAAAFSPLQALALLWAAGALAFACYHLFVWVRFHLAVARHSTPVTDKALLRQFAACQEQRRFTGRVRLAICPKIGSPMLVGVLRPVVLLPRGNISRCELRLIFLHEFTHCKRGDLVFKLAALAVKTLHWFNPLAHLLAKQIGDLCELSCDEALVRSMNNNQRRRYAFTILNQIGGELCKLPEAASGFSGEKRRVKRRLDLIMNFKKSKRLLLAVGIFAAAGLCTIGVLAASALNAKPAAPASSPLVGAAVPLGQTAGDDAQQELQDLNQKVAQLTEEQQALMDGIENSRTPDEMAAAPEEGAAVAAKYADDLNAFNFIWPIGKLGEAEIDEKTGKEPLSNVIVTPIWGYFGHTGTDIIAPKGSEILASAGGTVILAADDAQTGYGKHLMLDHGNGTTTLYGHCDELLVTVGAVVKQGDVIARVGRTGNATGYHCHFELRKDNSYLDARKFIGETAP